jgi:hypothetical protein
MIIEELELGEEGADHGPDSAARIIGGIEL